MEEQRLLKTQSSYKLIIPQHVEGKIRTLLREVHNIEWSGVLFYTYSGSFETNDLVLVCQDLVPMNIGSTGYTEFDVNEDIITYMTMHDLLDCQMGLIHSHHAMETFFSGTDERTLYEEGKDRINFLSLIVNNAGTYNARITEKDSVHVTRLIKATTKFFSDSEYSTETSDESEGTQIRYHALDIERNESPELEDQELLDRINELKANHPMWNKPDNSEFMEELCRNRRQYLLDNGWDKEPRQGKLFDDTEFIDEDELFDDVEIPDQKWADCTFAKLITGNMLVTKMPKQLNKALPTLNRLWREAELADPFGETDIAFCLVHGLLEDVPDNDMYAKYFINKLIETFPHGSQDFYGYDGLMESLEDYAL